MSPDGGRMDQPQDVQRDEQLAALLEEWMREVRSGNGNSAEFLARHPQWSRDLRGLLPVAALADEVGRAQPELTQTHSFDSRSDGDADDLATGGSLPRELGDFVLLEELGHGGMGVVFKARHNRLDRLVALKMVRKGELASAGDRARFQAEAEAAARLDHPHIVPVYEVGSHDGQPFFTMKYIDGTTLAQLLREGPLPPRRAARLLATVCRAVEAAHQNGVLHRDLKPSNILIDRDGQPHVSDFGLAKLLEQGTSLTHSGAVLGTPSFMAPEQAAGQRGQVSAATDVYSLGAILYQMLTGRPPFQSASAVDTLLLVLEQDPLPPQLLNPKADPDLQWITLKCLQKPSELRYNTAAELADDLEAYLAGEPIAARSGSFGQIIARMLRETHHATVLENWGLLWIWHSLVLLTLCLTTNLLQYNGVQSPDPYLALWCVGLVAWAVIFWSLRRRYGPITFVERQIAHVWAASIACSTLLFFIEILLRLPVLSLSPVLGLFSGSVFLVKAGILSGKFYFQAVALYLTSIFMAIFPQVGLTIFGVVSSLCFFLPGLKYYRQRTATFRAANLPKSE